METTTAQEIEKLTLSEASEQFGIPRQTIYGWVKRSKVTAGKNEDGAWWVALDSLWEACLATYEPGSMAKAQAAIGQAEETKIGKVVKARVTSGQQDEPAEAEEQEEIVAESDNSEQEWEREKTRAYEGGRKAYAEGLHKYQNPYQHDDVLHNEWDLGWRDARDEDEEQQEIESDPKMREAVESLPPLQESGEAQAAEEGAEIAYEQGREAFQRGKSRFEWPGEYDEDVHLREQWDLGWRDALVEDAENSPLEEGGDVEASGDGQAEDATTPVEPCSGCGKDLSGAGVHRFWVADELLCGGCYGDALEQPEPVANGLPYRHRRDYPIVSLDNPSPLEHIEQAERQIERSEDEIEVQYRHHRHEALRLGKALRRIRARRLVRRVLGA